MPNKFCRYLSNGYSFFKDNDQVLVKPCCLFLGPGTKLDSTLHDHRKKIYDSITDWTASCEVCENLEKTGQASLRQSGPDWINSDIGSLDAVTIDVQLDNDCNAACVICNKEVSSLWAKEQNKLDKKHIKLVPESKQNQELVDIIVNRVKFDKVTYIKFFGGEPLFTDTHLRFLQHVDCPNNITLHYTTNGSIYPDDKTFEIWKRFKVVIFAVSLDGIQDQFDYVRWPLNWHKVENNLKRLKQDPRSSNLMFRVEFTANLLNTYYFDRLETWVSQRWSTNQSGDPTEINIHLCSNSAWDPVFMPNSVRDQVLKKYQPNSIIHNLVKNLPEPLDACGWRDFVKTWEPRRNNHWRKAFPDLDWDGL
jgi:pyruvate-formate lyase-activating enzyme